MTTALLSNKLSEYSSACDTGLLVQNSSGLQVNEACISTLSLLCQNRQDGVGGTPTNILSDYTSNCSSFRFFMEKILVPESFGTTAENLNRQYMDPLKTSWCSKLFNYNNPECACLSVLARNSQFNKQCKLNITSCSAFPQDPSECYGQFFSKQNTGDSYNGQTFGPGIQFMNISFDRCQPYYCWTDVCWDPEVYKTYAGIRSQTVGCGNVCISVKGENTMTINDVTNASFNNIRPATTTMPICNKNDDSINLFYLPEFFRAPLNLFSTIPVSIGNQSNGIPAFIQLVSSESNNLLNHWWFQPPTGLQDFVDIPGGQQRTLNFTVNTELLQLLYSSKTPLPNPNKGNLGEVIVCHTDENPDLNSCKDVPLNSRIESPSYKYSYLQTLLNPDGSAARVTTYITLYANLIVLSPDLSPVAPATKTVPGDDPVWIRVLLLVSFLVLLIAYIVKTMANSYAVNIYPFISQPQNLGS
jgi:hypothetical protein